jgi:hypothetical protein
MNSKDLNRLNLSINELIQWVISLEKKGLTYDTPELEIEVDKDLMKIYVNNVDMPPDETPEREQGNHPLNKWITEVAHGNSNIDSLLSHYPRSKNVIIAAVKEFELIIPRMENLQAHIEVNDYNVVELSVYPYTSDEDRGFPLTPDQGFFWISWDDLSEIEARLASSLHERSDKFKFSVSLKKCVKEGEKLDKAYLVATFKDSGVEKIVDINGVAESDE